MPRICAKKKSKPYRIETRGTDGHILAQEPPTPPIRDMGEGVGPVGEQCVVPGHARVVSGE